MTQDKDRDRAMVDQLIKTCQDRAARSVLRPLLNGIPEMQIRAMRYLPKTWTVNQDLLFLIAGLIAEYPCEQNSTLSFGASLQKLSTHSEVKATGIERRLESLLQLDLESLTQPLHSLIVQARGTETPIDYTSLLKDLRRWDKPKKKVQRNWARDFWCPRENENDQNPDPSPVTDEE